MTKFRVVLDIEPGGDWPPQVGAHISIIWGVQDPEPNVQRTNATVTKVEEVPPPLDPYR